MCISEYINTHRLQQNHPCVIQIIRRDFLYYPLPETELHIQFPDVIDPSAGQSSVILPYLKNMVLSIKIKWLRLSKVNENEWICNIASIAYLAILYFNVFWM